MMLGGVVLRNIEDMKHDVKNSYTRRMSECVSINEKGGDCWMAFPLMSTLGIDWV